jgi:hypothetical protein
VISEQAKYEQVWAIPEYGRYSPGEKMLPLFRQMVRKKSDLIDFGCGCARATKHLQDDGYDVLGVDFVDARETDVPFKHHDLTKPLPVKAEMGYCCDVMEHIEPENVDAVLANIMGAVERCFFSIHFGPDHFGSVVGHPLHLTVAPFTWWLTKLKEHGKVKDARDLIGEGVFLVTGN